MVRPTDELRDITDRLLTEWAMGDSHVPAWVISDWRAKLAAACDQVDATAQTPEAERAR